MACFLVFNATAVDKYWRPVTSAFDLAANWDPIGVPGAGDRVVVDQFGNADMVVDASVSVGGWFQSDLYTSIVHLTNGITLTVGSQDFFLNSGGFYAGEGSMDVNGDFLVLGGGFDAPNTSLHIQGDLEINPWPLGGWFTEDCADYQLDGFGYTNVLNDISLSNLTVNKLGGFSVIIGAGLTLTCTGLGDFSAGYINGAGTIRFNGDTYIGPSSAGGTCLLEFGGTGTFVVQLECNNWHMDLLEVNKVLASDTVRILSSIPNLGFLAATHYFRVRRGVAEVDNNGNFHFKQHTTYIEPAGKLVAPQSTLYVEGDWENNGGVFDHNNGTVVLSALRYGTWNVDGTETFFNLNMSKPGGFAATITDGDVLRVENKMEFTQGYLNSDTGKLQVEDSLFTHSTHVAGSALVEMSWRCWTGSRNTKVMCQSESKLTMAASSSAK